MWTVHTNKKRGSDRLPTSFRGKASRGGSSSRGRGGRGGPTGPILGVGDELGAGDSYLVADILPAELAETAFESMRTEVKWNVMHHRGGEVPRLVAVEGEVFEDGSFPLYRHPADESPPLSPFSPTVAKIRDYVQQVLQHPVNHVLIQHYRSGKDYISEHSDKTIDVVRGSNIVNVSLGAQRTMTLRLKASRNTNDDNAGPADSPITPTPPTAPEPQEEVAKVPRPTQRIPLPNNSMFVMGPLTNTCWLHGINHDNRLPATKTPAELFNSGERISLTFRHIGTFLTPDETRIWGQGAKGKTRERAGKVVNGGKEAGRLIRAFGEENARNDFEWERWYGRGYDVLHFEPRDQPES